LNSFKLLLVFIVTTLLFTSEESLAGRKQKILVLHSYHQGLEWADNVSSGIQQVFEPHQAQYEIYYEYLDSKRNAGESFLQQSASFVNVKNGHERYEAVIVVDNNALALLNAKQIEFLDNPPIVFCGINNFESGLIDGLDQVTGVVETTDHIATLNLTSKLHPNRKQITVILDRTPTGERIRREFDDIVSVHKESLSFNFMRDFLLEDVPHLVNKLGSDDLIYMLTFNRDSDNNFISYTEGIEMIAKHSNVPIYGSWDFYLNKGIVGGKITAGELQGKAAGQMALRILKGERASDIEIALQGPSEYMFDYTYMRKHNVDLNELPPGSRVINQPQTFLEQHQTNLLNIFVFLFILVLGLLYKNKRKQHLMQARYAQQLEVKVNERTLELQLVNKQLERLSEIDSLSQLYNRRYFDTAYKRTIEEHRLNGKTMALFICDIDYFKAYNDSYGHLAGDECIKAVSQLIQSLCLSNQVVARVGGEEFAVILPDVTYENALQLAEAIRNGLLELSIPHKSSKVLDVVSLSIGVIVVIPEKEMTETQLFTLTDNALYESKNGGRNRVTIHRFDHREEVK
jgi:diguanylate cyclase (GGDEF)-like protein